MENRLNKAASKRGNPSSISEKNAKKRRVLDALFNCVSYVFSSFGVCILILIIGFVFSKGSTTLSWDFITSDYNTTTATCSYLDGRDESIVYSNPNLEGIEFSSGWGVGFEDSIDAMNEEVVFVKYADENSPFNNLVDTSTGEAMEDTINLVIDSALLKSAEGDVFVVTGDDGAETMAQQFNRANSIMNLTLKTVGGGTRASLETTLYMIGLTLVFALPLGIGCAIYLHEYSKENAITRMIRSLILATAGVPSIIFGLVGALIFIPFVNTVAGSNGGSIMSGALTLAIMLLPIIVTNTEEAMKTIPSSYKAASLALGASQTQTTFKVILPNAIPGILTGTLLAIGRIIGESAALIYATGASIQDTVLLYGSSTTLSVHIWSLMNGQSPNYQAACAIAIVIIVIDFILNIAVKMIGNRLQNKFKGVKN